jgi:hypothetical protein
MTVFSATGDILYSNSFIPTGSSGTGGNPSGSVFVGLVSPSSTIARILIDESDDNDLYPDANIGFDTFRFRSGPPARLVLTGPTTRLADGDTIILDEAGLGHRLHANPIIEGQLAELAGRTITVSGVPLADPLIHPHFPIGVREFRVRPGGALRTRIRMSYGVS